ncbi:MAG: ATP-binding protein, partial [Planctomycetota bacterium JB042]
VGNDAAGLPADAGARAFETFWRADAAREAGAHVGLGLPLCRRIAERLGGAIDATSADGRFVVTLRLPAA